MEVHESNSLLSLLLALITFTTAIQPTSKEPQCKNGTKKCGSTLTDNYHPDVNLPIPKIIRRHGYPAESHIVQTEDGYLLQMHRIPYGRRGPKYGTRQPVFLQHGVLTSSADWVIGGPNSALAYLLADEGYDVWLGNVRGNTYSRGHVSYSPGSLKFWDFSFHEMGYFDLPAEIDFILNRTDHTQLSYIGHSMGTTLFYVMASMRPEYNKKILGQISLAPIAYLSRMRSIMRYFTPFAFNFEKIVNWFGHGEFLSHNTVPKFVTKLNNGEIKVYEQILFAMVGYDPYQFRKELLPNILGHAPAGVSTKTLVHYSQLINSGKFRQFDYGKDKNICSYKSTFPPNYDLKLISSKVVIFYGDNDLLTNEQDVLELFTLLPNKGGLYKMNYTLFNHIDFLWAKDVKILLYNDLIQVLKSFS